MPLTLQFDLDDDQASRAAEIACRHFGHTPETCDATPTAHVQAYGAWMLARHVEMTERQLAEEAARQAVAPFFPNEPTT